MQPPTIRQAIGVVAFVLMAWVWHMVHTIFGPTEGFRFWGFGLLLVSVVFTARDSIPVTVGNKQLKPLEGWRKSYVLVPTYAIGFLVAAFPHQIACAVNLRGYVCQ